MALAGGQRIAWSITGHDLHANLIVLQQGESIPPHRNDDLDVLIIGIDGSGEISIDGAHQRLTPESVILIPRGTERSMSVLRAPFAYLTCHRRRAMLWPTSPAKPSEDGS